MYQGMFAIITPALISGAIAERIRFGPYCLFILLWVDARLRPAGPLGLGDRTGDDATGTSRSAGSGTMGALDFAGGTVVHIAAGFSGLAAILVLRKRLGYPEHAMHPNSMVLTLTGRRPALVRLVRLQRRQRPGQRRAGRLGARRPRRSPRPRPA